MKNFVAADNRVDEHVGTLATIDDVPPRSTPTLLTLTLAACNGAELEVVSAEPTAWMDGFVRRAERRGHTKPCCFVHPVRRLTTPSTTPTSREAKPDCFTTLGDRRCPWITARRATSRW